MVGETPPSSPTILLFLTNNIKKLLIRQIHAQFYSSQTPDIVQISDGFFNAISGFPVKSLVNKNCHTWDPVVILTWNWDYYLEVTWETRRLQQKSDNDVLSACYDVIVIFWIFVRFGESWIPDWWYIIYKFYLKNIHLLSS